MLLARALMQVWESSFKIERLVLDREDRKEPEPGQTNGAPVEKHGLAGSRGLGM